MSQNIKAGQDSLVVQSGGDTNIGMSTADMKQIMETLADQIPKYAAIASSIVEERLKGFEEKVMARFEDVTKPSNPEAFADPDFQYLLGKSQHAYARCGDDVTGDILVDLIAARSVVQQRSRLALSLNDAVEKSALLTDNEFAELSLVFLMRYSQKGLTSFPELCEYFKVHAGPLISSLSTERSSYVYLQAQSCATIEMGEVAFLALFETAYGGLLTLGNSKESFDNVVGGGVVADQIKPLLMPCIQDKTKMQLAALNRDQLHIRLTGINLEQFTDELWAVQASSMMTADQFVAKAKVYFPEIAHLRELWDSTPLKSLTLTTVGIAIGYANLKRLTPFDAELDIWIR